MRIRYHNEEFTFEIVKADDLAISGFLKLDEKKRARFKFLNENEDENWYLDEDGERLGPDKLFTASPWSVVGPNGEVKLLCRFLDHNSGEVRFNTQEAYGGELWKWLRTES